MPTSTSPQPNEELQAPRPEHRVRAPCTGLGPPAPCLAPRGHGWLSPPCCVSVCVRLSGLSLLPHPRPLAAFVRGLAGGWEPALRQGWGRAGGGGLAVGTEPAPCAPASVVPAQLPPRAEGLELICCLGAARSQLPREGLF